MPGPRTSRHRFVIRHSSFVIQPQRSGYTLMEMILVLAVLAAFASVAWPAMIHTYNNFQLKQAAEKVRLKCAGTRIHAIDSSLPYQFRYEPEGRRFLVLPYETEEGIPGTFADEDEGPPPNFVISGQLPKEIIFRPDDEDQPTVRMDQETLEGLPEASRLADVDWSLPVLFYADGSATAASFRVVDKKKRFIRLSVRELTGSVNVAMIQQENQR